MLIEEIDHNFHGTIPSSWGFCEGAPGLSFLTELSTRVGNTITLILDILVLVRIIFLTGNPDARIFGSFGALFFAIVCYAPSNVIGGVGDRYLKEIVLELCTNAYRPGYIFYTKNTHFHRLHGIYKMIFDVKYRETLVRDGASEYLCSSRCIWPLAISYF